MSKNRFNYIVNELDLNIKFKDKLYLMKLIGYIMFFNKNFMKTFTTTIGKTIYFPSEQFLNDKNYKKYSTLFHEKIHIDDGISNKSFKFLYLFPQILAPICLLFCLYAWWIGLSLFILCILPYPAKFRKDYELKAYKVSLFAEYELSKELNITDDERLYNLENYAFRYNEYFTGNFYYYMWRRWIK